MTRVATPESEEYLLMLAEHGTAAHFERIVRGVRQAHAEQERRRADDDAGAGCCELEDGSVLAPETARRLACDAGVVRLLEDVHGEPLDVGRKTRSIPPAIRRALKARDAGCRFPGCDATAHVEGHHIEHWAHGGE